MTKKPSGLAALEAQAKVQKKKDERRIQRNVARAYAWATRQSRADLESAFANLLPMLFERKMLSIRLSQLKMVYEVSAGAAELRADEFRRVAVEQISANYEHRRARQRGAEGKKLRDPAQKAKPSVKSLWLDWQDGRSRYKSAAAFYRHVVDSVSGVTSEKTVERWSRKWSAERQAGRK